MSRPIRSVLARDGPGLGGAKGESEIFKREKSLKDLLDLKYSSKNSRLLDKQGDFFFFKSIPWFCDALLSEDFGQRFAKFSRLETDLSWKCYINVE